LANNSFRVFRHLGPTDTDHLKALGGEALIPTPVVLAVNERSVVKATVRLDEHALASIHELDPSNPPVRVSEIHFASRNGESAIDQDSEKSRFELARRCDVTLATRAQQSSQQCCAAASSSREIVDNAPARGHADGPPCETCIERPLNTSGMYDCGEIKQGARDRGHANLIDNSNVTGRKLTTVMHATDAQLTPKGSRRRDLRETEAEPGNVVDRGGAPV
jgi:hypothetical protein